VETHRTGKLAIGRVVLSTREHVVALEAREKGVLDMLLHYPYEVRKPEEYSATFQTRRPPRR
jgi:DNA end-binding protein Ku